MMGLADQQEIVGALADMIIETYAMESTILRTQKVIERSGEAAAKLPIAMTQIYITQAMEKIEAAARKVIAAVADGDMLRTQLAIVRRLAKYEPFNTIALRQTVAQRVIEAEKYVIA
jgi:butyryl-CoA dehydrogenase